MSSNPSGPPPGGGQWPPPGGQAQPSQPVQNQPWTRQPSWGPRPGRPGYPPQVPPPQVPPPQGPPPQWHPPQGPYGGPQPPPHWSAGPSQKTPQGSPKDSAQGSASTKKLLKQKADEEKLKILLTTPEGLELSLKIGRLDQRLSAMAVDCLILFGGIIVFAIVGVFSPLDWDMFFTLLGMFSFLATTLYFTWFELSWQGRTPGKKALGLRVIKRDGGELTAASIIARNLTREVELFLPLGLLLSALASRNPMSAPVFLAWAAFIAIIPLLSKKRLRIGDLIGGTMVVSMPKKALSPDLTRFSDRLPDYAFTDEQLGVYGNLELQTLETLLREAETGSRERRRNSLMAMTVVADKIRRKINLPWAPPKGDEYRFLKAFYLAEREVLEKGLILGRRKESKLDPVESVGRPSEKRPE